MLLAALLLDASSSSPYIHEIGHHLQQVTLARYLHAAGCTTAGRFILIALHTWEWSALAMCYVTSQQVALPSYLRDWVLQHCQCLNILAELQLARQVMQLKIVFWLQ